MCLVSSALCRPLLLFPIVDINLTLVAFMGEFPSLILAQRFALSVEKLAAASDRVRTGC